MPRVCDVRKIDGEKTCDRPPVDLFSIGHAIFGLVAGSFYLVISYYFYSASGFSDQASTLIVSLSFFVGIGIFLTWDVLEHKVISSLVYEKKWGQKGWCETRMNIFLDVVIASICFQVAFLPTFLFVRDWIGIVSIWLVFQMAAVVITMYLSKKGFIGRKRSS